MMRILLATVLAMALLGAGSARAADLRDDVRQWRMAHEMEIAGDLADLISLRSVAADPAGLRATADRLETELRSRGFTTRQLSADGSAPLVFGELMTRGARRTVTFYAHYDGQPVTPSQWRSDPFAPVMRTGMGADASEVDWRKPGVRLDPEWRLFGRAASDDKSSIVAFLAAMDALKATGRKPTVNIKVVWEGEEEAGSIHLPKILSEHAALFRTDLWLIGDAPVHQSRERMIYFGARGVMSLEMTLYGPLRPLHDGHYGNWAPNPAAAAADLLARMRGPDGAILVPGIGDKVRPLNDDERRAIAALPPVEAALMAQFGIARSESAEGLTLSTMRPSLNIRGLQSGRVGDEAVNAIPTEAVVSLDFRLVPDQTPEDVRRSLESWLEAGGWTIVADTPDAAARAAHPKIIRLVWEEGYPALRSDMASAPAKAVLAAAGRSAGKPVLVLPMIGGSVPIYMFSAVSDAPIIGLPIGNHDNNQHAANENARLQNLWDGVEIYAAMLADLAW